jgi:hypothetical protein
VIVDDRTKKTFRVISRAGQLLYYIRLAAPGLAFVKNGVGEGACDVYSVWPSTAPLV